MVVGGGWRTPWMLQESGAFISDLRPPVNAQDIKNFMDEFAEKDNVPIIAGFDFGLPAEAICGLPTASRTTLVFE